MADTWLHVTTRSVDFVNIEPVALGDHSFGLMQRCTSLNNSFDSQKTSPCSIDYTSSDAYLMSSEPLLVLNNVSDLAIAATHESYVYLAVPPQTGLAQQDYTANTFGMLTLCENITLKCTMVSKGNSISPGCGIYSYAAGQLKLIFYTDSTMASNDTDTVITNPYFFGLISSVLNTGGDSGAYSW